MTLLDQQARDRALDTEHSFIVQAPAGSGKTELLIGRILALLASTVDKPEQILAITFTKKAAAQMRARVIEALLAAKANTPCESYQSQTRTLANAVLKRDEQLGWRLIENPQSLRIQTIDAFCGYLISQMPLTSRCGSIMGITDNPDVYYERAALTLLNNTLLDEAHQSSMTTLLLHMDNQSVRVITLIKSLLAKRDQWLPLILIARSIDSIRDIMQVQLHTLISQTLATLTETLVADDLMNDCTAMLKYSLSNLPDSVLNPDAVHLDETTESLPYWQHLITLLLTKANTWRSSHTKKQGFPAKSSTKDKQQSQQYDKAKQRIAVLVACMAEDDTLLDQLVNITVLPSAQYSESQWAILSALFDLLPLACAYLQAQFIEHSVIDFVAMGRNALEALGEDDSPTDLACQLDNVTKHILIDEFQDTSITHYQLMERYTRDWHADAQRTIFIVGDPMQSIYRFRDANVNLFIKTQQSGLGNNVLEPLSLKMNFRSTSSIIDWVNHAFTRVFPQRDDTHFGAVRYHPSTSPDTTSSEHGASLLLHHERTCTPSETILEQINLALSEDPEQSIAVLVRNRTHLKDLLTTLSDANIDYQAVDISPLGHYAAIQDCLTLTRAMLQEADRLAWFSLLRSPLIGLTLDELSLFAEDDVTIWSQLNDPGRQAHLNAQALARVQQFNDRYQQLLSLKGRCQLTDWIQSAWLRLGGPACYSDIDIERCNRYFAKLDTLDDCDDPNLYPRIEEIVYSLFDVQHHPDASVQVMTIHKSKGLEFDTVIVPSLEKTTRSDAHSLIAWHTLTTAQQHEFPVIMAPIQNATEPCDTIYQYLRHTQRQATKLEASRLLYVACTRARRRLILCATIDTTKDDYTPPSASFLAMLWDTIPHQFARDRTTTENDNDFSQDNTMRRLTYDWQLPNCVLAHPETQLPLKLDRSNHPDPYSSADKRILGTFAHKLYELLASRSSTVDQIERSKRSWATQLRALGLSEAKQDLAYDLLSVIVARAQQSKRAAWILDSTHEQSECEFAVSSSHNGRLATYVIDRTFIFENERWIIDYKFIFDESQSSDQLTDHVRQQYERQLYTYHAILSKIDTRPIRLALYLPYQDIWIELKTSANKHQRGINTDARHAI